MAMEQYRARTRPIDLSYGTDESVTFNFFNAVYAWMCVGLAVTAVVAYFVSLNTALVVSLNAKGIILAMALGLWVLAMFVQSAAMRISAAAGTALFILYSGLMGAMLSYVFLLYRLPTIGAAFLLTAGTFGAMSVYGFVTKRDLTSIGSYLFMGLIGLFIASLVNIFMASSLMSWIITYAVLGLSMALTVYKTQMLKGMAEQTRGDREMAARAAIVGSLLLYISFINMFMSILRILGSRK